MEVFELSGRLNIKGIDKAGTQLGGIQARVQKMAKGLKIAGVAMTAAGGIIVGVAGKAIKDYAKAGDEVHKMSLRTGIATETLSRLKYAAELGGASLATVEKANKRLASTLEDAKDGLSTATDAFDKLGLSVEDFEGLSPEEAFMKMSGAVADIEDPLMRSAIAQDVFGRAGTEMLPMLSEGTEGLKKMMDEAEKFAPIFEQEAAEAAAKLTDTMGQLKGTMDKVKIAIAERLVPILIPLIEKIRDIIGKVTDWMKENPGLTKTIIIITTAIGGLMLFLGPLLIILPGLVAALPLLGAAFAVLTGPVGLIIAAIVGLIAVGVLVWKNWDKIKVKAMEIWGGIVSFFQGVWATITTLFQQHWDKILAILFPAIGIPILIARNWDEILAFLKTIPGKIGNAFAPIKDIILAPFQAAWEGIGKGINWVIDTLNSIKIPAIEFGGVVLFKGWEGANIPNVEWPSFKHGGIVPGPIGQPVPVIAHGGERFGGMGSQAPVVNVYIEGSVISDRDLGDKLREIFIDIKERNTSIGF